MTSFIRISRSSLSSSRVCSNRYLVSFWIFERPSLPYFHLFSFVFYIGKDIIWLVLVLEAFARALLLMNFRHRLIFLYCWVLSFVSWPRYVLTRWNKNNRNVQNFWALKVSNICQQTFQSCCQSFKFGTFLRSENAFTHWKWEGNDWYRRLDYFWSFKPSFFGDVMT